MRIVHLVLFKLLSLLVLATGLLLVVMHFRSSVYVNVTAFIVERWVQLAPAAGALLFILGLLGLLPLSRKKRPSTISFPGDYGEVTIHLDSIEATLNRIVSKMPEVKKISVRLIPSEDGRKAEVTGSLWIYKGSEAIGASEIVSKVQKYLRDTAINILGVEEIVMGRLDVPGIIVSASMPKPAAPADAKPEKIVAAAPTPEPVAAPVVPEEPSISRVDIEPSSFDEPAASSTAFDAEEGEKPEDSSIAWGAGGETEDKEQV